MSAPSIAALLAVIAAVVPGVAVEAGAPPTDPVLLVDDTGTLSVTVPSSWTDVDTAPGSNDDGTVMPWISAAPDYDAYRATFDVSGVVFVAVGHTSELERWIDQLGQADACATERVEPYDDGAFAGLRATFGHCGPAAAATFVVVAANLIDYPEPTHTYVLQIQAASATDTAAIEEVLASFNVVGVTSTAPADPSTAPSDPGPDSPAATLPAAPTPITAVTLPDGTVLQPVLVDPPAT